MFPGSIVCLNRSLMWSLSVKLAQDNLNFKMCSTRVRITRPGQVAVQGVNSSAEQALNSTSPTNEGFLPSSKAIVWFFSYWLQAFVNFPSVLIPTVTHPIKCQTLTGGKNYKIQYDLALIKPPPMCRSSKQGENLTSAFLP